MRDDGGNVKVTNSKRLFLWVGRWCSMAPTISGPETDSLWVEIWWRNKQFQWQGCSLMPTSWTLQTGCHVPKPGVKEGGDTCNREMGETSPGTRLSEATPYCLWSQVDTCKEDQTSLCIPMRPTYELSNGTQPLLLPQECSTHFYMGEGDPYPYSVFEFSWFELLVFDTLVVSVFG